MPKLDLLRNKLNQPGGSEMEVNMIAIDLAKSSFEVRGSDAFGKVLFRKSMNRQKLKEFLLSQKPCRVAMEACGTSHYWGREVEQMGHRAELLPARSVHRITKHQKNDRNDTDAIAIAANLEGIHFVPVKKIWQQDLQSVHRARDGVVKSQTALINQTRGLLAEYGVVIARGALRFKKELPDILEDSSNGLSDTLRTVLNLNREMLLVFDRQKESLEALIKNFAKSNEDCQRLMKVPGVGVLTSTLFVSTVGDPRQFKNGRDAAAWLGLVPRQNTTGGKIKLLGITKAGDQHLRTALIHGARSKVLSCIRHDTKDRYSEWIKKLVEKKGWNKTSVAVANKMTRIMWHLLAHKEEFDAKKIA